jgi:16S rRNA (guanine527-N7)-methyltransferase
MDTQNEPRQRELIEHLLRENQKFNLTSVREPGLAYIKHIEDSLQALQTGLFDEARRVIDVGCGAGFPGLPLAIARPQLHLIGLDSTRKKCDFVQETMRLFEIEGSVVCERAEVAGHDKALRDKCDIAVCRAVGSIGEVLELCAPFVGVGGHVVLWRGQDAPREVEEAKVALKKLSCAPVQVLGYELEQHETRYHLAVIEKTARTPSGYPRRVGLPKQKPIL